MADKFVRLVVPQQRINPNIPVMAFSGLAGNRPMDERTAYLRGLLRGENPFLPEQEDLTDIKNIGKLRAELKRRAQAEQDPLVEALAMRRRMQVGAQ